MNMKNRSLYYWKNVHENGYNNYTQNVLYCEIDFGATFIFDAHSYTQEKNTLYDYILYIQLLAKNAGILSLLDLNS